MTTPTGSDDRVSLSGSHSPDENGSGVTFFFRHEIKQPVHPVGEIDIGVPRRTVHHRCAGCKAGARVAAEVVFAAVRFGLGDNPGNATARVHADQAGPQ